MVKGLNFSQKKYKIINKYTFIPHIRSNYHASVPKTILDNFPTNSNNVGLFKINNKIRIKKLHKEGNSLIISLKAEKCISPKITVLDIKSENDLLDRKLLNENSTAQFIPKYTRSKNSSTPIYVFENKNKLFVGGYYKKDLTISKEICFDDKNLSALGLYFAEGGKIDASFTNSWPTAINSILHFVKNMFGLKMGKIKVSIYCNPKLKNKKSSLEEFWSKETGVENFSKNLHFGKNSRSPQGTLEIYFCSIIIKDVFISLLNKIFTLPIEKMDILNGILSGDGSPIQQTKYSITHHIPFNKNDIINNKEFLDASFSGFSKSINSQSRFVIYPRWEQNKFLLLNDAYAFNPINRLKFAYRFFKLPRTYKEIEHDKELQQFKRREYKILINNIKNHYKKLINLELFDEKKLEKILNAYSLY